jgi:hypothetical protein
MRWLPLWPRHASPLARLASRKIFRLNWSGRELVDPRHVPAGEAAKLTAANQSGKRTQTEEAMDFKNTIAELKQERRRLRKELIAVDQTLRALGRLVGNRNAPLRTGRKIRKLSAAARKKISRAAKARWAKLKRTAS